MVLSALGVGLLPHQDELNSQKRVSRPAPEVDHEILAQIGYCKAWSDYNDRGRHISKSVRTLEC